jgi:mannose-6-phosphate isomerase
VTIRRLSDVVQNYRWGSYTILAQFQGRGAPTPTPEAELWFGAHPQAPSSIEVDGETYRLDAFINRDPQSQLGIELMRRYDRLPFLLKVLAVDQPLSIQVHPSQAQAQLGFQRERARAIAVDDAKANYRDNWPKPELLCPLTEFEVLCGFRPVDELIDLFETLGGDCFKAAKKTLESNPNPHGLRQLVASWLNASRSTQDSLFTAGMQAFEALLGQSNSRHYDVAFLLDLAVRYPGDMGVLVALLLRHRVLSPGTALFVPAGVLHAYLRGFGIEVMANSDNVLRGGLTPKHVDVGELLDVANFESEPPVIVALEDRGPLEKIFAIDAPHFSVSRIDIKQHTSWCASRRLGPEMLLCVDGTLNLLGARDDKLALARGECAWISADEDIYCVSGAGQAFRVQAGSE